MDAATVIRRARQASGLSLRTLARRAGTSHATIAAYEAGRSVPRFDTVDRILRAAGFSASIAMSPRPDATPAERSAKGRELQLVLELAEAFPVDHGPGLTFPRFPSQPAP